MTAADVAAPFELAPGWRIREASGPGPFVTSALLERPDGTVVEWTSRRHRKRLGLRAPGQAPLDRRVWERPATVAVVLGALFGIGSALFALGSLPAVADRVPERSDAWVFFLGSIFFTSAAYGQFREAVVAPVGPHPGAPEPVGLRRLVGWSPRRIDWWAASIQLVGT
ncbi:MAG: hypothetical protein AAGK32_00675, partial [Actinomycetota bacterium]